MIAKELFSTHNLPIPVDENLTPPALQKKLVEIGMEEVEILNVLSKILEIQIWKSLKGKTIHSSFTAKVPFETAKKYQMVVIKDERPLKIALCELQDLAMVDEISLLLDEPLEIVLSPKDEIIGLINSSYAVKTKTAEVVLEELKDINLESITKEINPSEDLMDMAHKAPIVKLVNTILFQALKQRASDIHIQPYEQSVVVRYRIDGMLYPQMEIPKELQDAIISRVKVMGKMDIAERRLPQDGGTSLTASGRIVDVRISSLPSAHGERIVFRLQDKSSGLYDLAKVGLEDDQRTKIERLIELSHGIILVTGPTGSGKTTTLYSALKVINTAEKNIITIEDPVEYMLEGISQIQVAVKKGLTFASGIRSIVRQDPDVIMIGEIRDLETARIAIQSALTGHLVFSTLHTNDAPGAITRLLDIGIEPYLAASSLLAVIAQRLVRVLCLKCKKEYTPDPKEWTELGFSPENPPRSTLFKGDGCKNCFDTGFEGRKGIYEILAIDDAVKKQILDHTPSSIIKNKAVEEGRLTTLRMAALAKMLEGSTTFQEVLRVTQDVNV